MKSSCVCTHRWHTADCPHNHCGCTIYEPDDGTPTPEASCYGTWQEPYTGIYQGVGRYTL